MKALEETLGFRTSRFNLNDRKDKERINRQRGFACSLLLSLRLGLHEESARLGLHEESVRLGKREFIGGKGGVYLRKWLIGPGNCILTFAVLQSEIRNYVPCTHCSFTVVYAVVS